MDLNNVS